MRINAYYTKKDGVEGERKRNVENICGKSIENWWRWWRERSKTEKKSDILLSTKCNKRNWNYQVEANRIMYWLFVVKKNCSLSRSLSEYSMGIVVNFINFSAAHTTDSLVFGWCLLKELLCSIQMRQYTNIIDKYYLNGISDKTIAEVSNKRLSLFKYFLTNLKKRCQHIGHTWTLKWHFLCFSKMRSPNSQRTMGDNGRLRANFC